MLAHRKDPAVGNLFELGFGKRPAEEIYDLRKDPGELRNLAADPTVGEVKAKLAAELDGQLKAWRDPRALGQGDVFDSYPMQSAGERKKPGKKKR